MEKIMTKAIIEVSTRDEFFAAARAQLAAGTQPGGCDYRLSFTSARDMHGRLSPARLDLLRTLKKRGACNVRTLAAAAERNYSNVHADVEALLELGLMERLDDGTVRVPFDAIEIRVLLEQAA